VAGFYAGTSLYISAHRLLWYDEVYTTILCRQPTVGTLWAALRAGLELIPALYFLVARIFDQLFRHSDVGIRIPSVLAWGAGLLLTFDIARRLTDGLGGLIAMALVSTSYANYYGYEARPYAICFMLAAIALWLWVFTSHESWSAAAAFGAVFLIGGSMHYYFLACVVPFAILALAERRIFHPKVIAAALGAMGSLAALYPQIAGSLTKLHSGVLVGVLNWASPSLVKLDAVYLGFLPLATVPLISFIAGVAVFGRFRERLVRPMSEGERVSWLFLTIPLTVYVVAVLVTHFFVDRYMIGTVPGIAVAVTCFFWRHCRESRYLPLVLLVAIGGFGIFLQLLTLRNIDHIDAFGDHQGRTRHMVAVEDALQRDGKRLFVFSDNLMFLEAWYYSKYRSAYELFWPAPSEGTLETYASLKLPTVKDIVAHAGETAVIYPSWLLLEELQRAGLHPKIHSTQPDIFYLE
jgi:Dolichyl-phosphate-mannose-protein mannosyltransferase